MAPKQSPQDNSASNYFESQDANRYESVRDVDNFIAVGGAASDLIAFGASQLGVTLFVRNGELDRRVRLRATKSSIPVDLRAPEPRLPFPVLGGAFPSPSARRRNNEHSVAGVSPWVTR